jgi:hypothetical protein
MPVIEIKIMIAENDIPPRTQERIAFLIGTHDWENKMQIRMLKFLKLKTGRASATTILLRPMGAVQVLRIRKRELQLTDT